MKTQLAQRLKEVLNQMSQEDFDKVWVNIVDMKMEGPTFEDAIEYFSVPDTSMSSFRFGSLNDIYSKRLEEDQVDELSLAA